MSTPTIPPTALDYAALTAELPPRWIDGGRQRSSEINALSLRLVTRGTTPPRLTDADFATHPVRLALSEHLSAEIIYNSKQARSVAVGTLRKLGLNATRAWDLAADNILDRARCNHSYGVQVQHRPLTLDYIGPPPAVEINSPTDDTTAWLCHPHLFSMLHQRLTQLLASEDLRYEVGSESRIRVFSPAAQNYPDIDTTRAMLLYRAGYPFQLGT